MNNIYELRLYDTNLLTFAFESGELGGNVVKITSIEKPSGVLPCDLELTDASVLQWLERRIIPKNREFVHEILSSLGLAVNDVQGVISTCKGLSLNDSYWVVPVGFTGKFADYNLYENRFSEILSLVAYTGNMQSDAAFSTSPELTTDGMLRKAWRFIDGEGIVLYKGGTTDYANAGKEPYSEFYASQVAQTMGLDAVEYGLENWKGMLASTCKLFTDINTSYIPIGRIVTHGGLDAVVKHYDTLGGVFSESIRDMLVFDALIYNTDRHYGNFGLLRNSSTGEIIAPAPIFDNGAGLFAYAMPNEYENLDEYALTRHPVYPNTTFEQLVKALITPRQVAQLRKMLNFTFSRHPKLNLPESHLTAIEKHLRKRATQLISLAGTGEGYF